TFCEHRPPTFARLLLLPRRHCSCGRPRTSRGGQPGCVLASALAPTDCHSVPPQFATRRVPLFSVSCPRCWRNDSSITCRSPNPYQSDERLPKKSSLSLSSRNFGLAPIAHSRRAPAVPPAPMHRQIRVSL